MTVIILTNCPAGLRGFLTRWLLEISPGVFLGSPSARVRKALWTEVRQYAGQGRALIAYQTNNEQGYVFETHDHAWHPTDHEGLTPDPSPQPTGPTLPEQQPTGDPSHRLEQGIQAPKVRQQMNSTEATCHYKKPTKPRESATPPQSPSATNPICWTRRK